MTDPEIRARIAQIRRNITDRAAQGWAGPEAGSALVLHASDSKLKEASDALKASARRALLVEYRKLYSINEAVRRADSDLKKALEEAGRQLVEGEDRAT